jgi:hypothetical protein
MVRMILVRGRPLLGGLVLLALLAGCGLGSDQPRPGSGDAATRTALHGEIGALQGRVASAEAALPPEERATPLLPLAQAWRVGIAGVERVGSIPNYATTSGAPLTLVARGVFVVAHLQLVNTGTQAATQFPWWNLRLRDRLGRTFSPDEDATVSYGIADPAVRRARQAATYKPGVVAPGAVVFDVPGDAVGVLLTSADGTLHRPLPVAPATPTSPARIAITTGPYRRLASQKRPVGRHLIRTGLPRPSPRP